MKSEIEWLNDDYGTITDKRDNQKYKCVRIGSQIWMAENLAYAPEDEPLITRIENSLEWENHLSGNGWCFYMNDQKRYESLGVLYNWQAAKRACLIGWSIPSDDDWTLLNEYLLDRYLSYDWQKEKDETAKFIASTSGWRESKDEGAVGYLPQENNSSGFSAIGSGLRNEEGRFQYCNRQAYFWTSTSKNIEKSAITKIISYNSAYIQSNLFPWAMGLSVRCILNGVNA